MKKIFFLDLGIRNIIVKNFNSPDLRTDTGALFENFVYLEILKNTETFHTINFYRTRDGAEVDFILDDMLKKISFEVKYKSLKNAAFYKALDNFNNDESISQSFVVNLQLNTQKNGLHYIPVFLIEKTISENIKHA